MPELPVHTAWDIGRQTTPPSGSGSGWQAASALVGYFENSGEGMPYYADELHKLYAAKGWRRKGAVDYVPHDARVTEWGIGPQPRSSRCSRSSSTRLIATELSLADGINAVRADPAAVRLRRGRPAARASSAEGYRKEWDEDTACWKDKPRHDCLARRRRLPLSGCAYRDWHRRHQPKPKPRWAGDGRLTVDDLIALHGRNDIRIRV